MKRAIYLMGIVGMLTTLSSCNFEVESGGNGTDMSKSDMKAWVGGVVKVQFRRDALGAASNNPIPPRSGNHNGADTTIVGKLVKIEATGIVVEVNQNKTWVPREVILMVEKQG